MCTLRKHIYNDSNNIDFGIVEGDIIYPSALFQLEHEFAAHFDILIKLTKFDFD
jgi:hypothetical protein